VNLTGCMYCLRAELKCVVDGGSIVNMASIHGTNGIISPFPLFAPCVEICCPFRVFATLEETFARWL